MHVEEVFELPEELSQLTLPLYNCPVSTGFPSPADNFIDLKLDLNHYLIKNPTTTFFVRVSGDSMIKAGIHDGDILTVDRSLFPGHNKIVIAVVNGECTVKRILYTRDKIYLAPENDHYTTFEVNEFMSFDIWGVVTNVIHPL